MNLKITYRDMIDKDFSGNGLAINKYRITIIFIQALVDFPMQIYGIIAIYFYLF